MRSFTWSPNYGTVKQLREVAVDYARKITPRITPDGMVEIRLSGEWARGVTVYPDEWEAFIRDVKEGKWDGLTSQTQAIPNEEASPDSLPSQGG